MQRGITPRHQHWEIFAISAKILYEKIAGMNHTSHVEEPSRSTPIAEECDVCVVGGSCTGVFAAVRAARLGMRVALIEQNVIFGGMATSAQVNEWHSLYDTFFEKTVIGGLTVEVVERLRKRGAVLELPKGGRGQFRFNAAELAGELDQLVRENRIRPFLAARCVAAPVSKNEKGLSVNAVILEDKSGRRAVKASVYIDASGDGDLVRQAGFPVEKPEILQPVNLQALVSGLQTFRQANPKINLWESVRSKAGEYNYPLENSSPWFFEVPGTEGLVNIFGPRRNGVDASDADQLTAALMEGRRHHRALLDMFQQILGAKGAVAAWPHSLGVRETWHARCEHRLTGPELLNGENFFDAIAQGTYPVDIHHSEGTLLRFLDGREEKIAKDGTTIHTHWRDAALSPSCYRVPYRTLLPLGSANVLVAGRVLDADREAFAGVRVMVNMNQTGEAAGVAAALAVKNGLAVSQVDTGKLRETLNAGGSLLGISAS